MSELFLENLTEFREIVVKEVRRVVIPYCLSRSVLNAGFGHSVVRESVEDLYLSWLKIKCSFLLGTHEIVVKFNLDFLYMCV